MHAYRPVKDGIQTAVELREWEEQHKRQRKLPLCAVTGNASDASVKRIKDAGMDFVLSKPYQIGDLLEYVRLLPPPMSADSRLIVTFETAPKIGRKYTKPRLVDM